LTETVVIVGTETEVVEVGYAQPAGANIQITGDLGGTEEAVEVVSTHLTAPLPPDQGGTGLPGLSGLLAAIGGASATGLAGEITRATDAESGLAPLNNPALTGTPTAPTAPALTSSIQVATTAYTDSAVAAAPYVPGRSVAFDLVHDFGADPTGAASSVSALTTAIATATAARVAGSSAQGYGGSTVPSGGTPLITGPPGAYLIDSTVALPSYLRLNMPGAVFFDPTGLVTMFTTTAYGTVLSGLRCRGGYRHIYVQTSNVNDVVLRIDECEFNGATESCIETDGGSRSTNLILSRPRITTGGTGTRALKLGSGDHVQWNGGWLDGNTDYFIELGAGTLWVNDVLGVPGNGTGAWVLVDANANPAFGTMLTIEKFRFGGENPKTLVEWHAAPQASFPTHLSIRSSQVNIAGKPAVYFYDMPNTTDLANLEGMTGGGWLFTFDPSLPLTTKQLIGQEAVNGGVMVQADRTSDKLVMFTNASDPDTVAAVIAQLQR
jgi:hypothetical protein